MKYTPSIACANQLNLEKDIEEIYKTGIRNLHIDIMDGNYVPNLCLSLDTIKQISTRFPSMKLDTHIMVTNPDDYIVRLQQCGIESLAFHINATNFSYRTIQKIKSHFMRAGIVLNPSEPVSILAEIVDEIDYVLVMGIEPGFSGQKFIEKTYKKVVELAKIRQDKQLSFDIFVDGGISPQIGKSLVEIGADYLVLGYPAIFNQPDGIQLSFNRFKDIVEGDKR
jgi:ribulose-phosphate 3-epimerase